MKLRKITSAHILAFLFSLVIFVFFVTTCVNFFRSSILGHTLSGEVAAEGNEAESSNLDVNWEEIYPFEENADDAQNEVADDSSKNLSFVQKSQAVFESVKEKIDYYTTHLISWRMNFVELNAAFNKTIGMKMISGSSSVVVMSNEYLTYTTIQVDVSEYAKNLIEFERSLSEKNIDFLYVQAPSKEDKYDNQLPAGIADYNNINADNLLQTIEASPINYLDLREAIKDQKIDFYSSFFKTDHHWKPETGLWAASETIKKLNDLGYTSIDEALCDKQNFDVEVFEDYCFGSQGKKVSLSFADPENISVITPKNKTQFTVNYYNLEDPIKRGSFKDTMMNMSVFDKKDYYNVSTYASYLYGVRPLVSIENETVSSGKKVLFLADSFALCSVPYLSMGVKHVDLINLNYFSGSVSSFIEKNQPDIVVVFYNPSALELEDLYDFR